MEHGLYSPASQAILMELKGLGRNIVGVRENIPNEVYHHKLCPGVQNTGLKKMLEGPHNFKWWLDHEDQSKEAYRRGGRAHEGILEGPKFMEKYFMLPPGLDFRKKADKEIRAKAEEENKGKIALKAEEFQRIGGMIESVWSHPKAAELLSGKNMREVSAWAVHPRIMVLCKVRPDIYNLDQGALVSLKSVAATANPNPTEPHSFRKTVVNKGYHMAEAFYFDIFSMAIQQSKARIPMPGKLFWIVVQNNDNGPFPVRVFNMTDLFFNIGRSLYEHALGQIVECNKTKYWGHADRDVITLDPPSWLVPDEMKEGGL